MKRKVYLILALVLIFALISMPVSAAKPVEGPARIPDTVLASVNPADHQAAVLMAGQDMPVGFVYINACFEVNTYEVRYEVTEPGWFLTEIHFEAINEGDDVFIENNGTLIPGKFTAKGKFDLTSEVTEYSFRYESGADVIEFAAHAVVGQHAVTHMEYYPLTIVSDTETLFYDANATEPDWVPSVATWVHGSWPSIAGATWIWESYNALNPRAGDTVEFKREFTVQGTPTAATFSITTDNEYTFDINGIPVGGDNDWTTIETGDVLAGILTGENLLNITAINWAWPTDSPTTNPGGLLYKLEIMSEELVVDVPEIYESAWGAGVDAGTKNWSMVIPKEDIGPYLLLVQTLQVPSTTRDGVTSDALASGEKYLIEATGTYRFATWAPPADSGFADAKFNCREGSYIPDLTGMIEGIDYVINSDGTVWVDGFVAGYLNGLQVRIDSNWAHWDGNFNTGHRYTKEVDGSDSGLLFAIWDNVYTDNAGEITIKIYQYTW